MHESTEMMVFINSDLLKLLPSNRIAGLDSNASAWTWLRENNIPPCGAREITASDQAWSLLQSYLSRLEDGSGVCHKCVAFTLLSQSFPLPTWLVHSYKVFISSLG